MGMLILIGTLCALLVVGFPIGFSLMLAAGAYTLHGGFNPSIVIERYLGTMDSFTFLAIPFFLLAANVMNQIGVTERIFNFANALMGHYRGGLAQVNVLASMVFAGMSGSNSADVAGLGTIETQAMLKRGYDPSFTAAVTAASSTIGPIIPPSISMVVWAGLAGVSVGRMFAGAIIPGIIMGASMMVLIHVLDRFGFVSCPRRSRAGMRELGEALWHALPALVTPVIIIGGILGGVVTPTEAGVLATVYALVLGVCYRQLRFASLIRAIDDTIVATCFIMLMVAGAHAFGWAIAIEKLPEAFAAVLFSITSSPFLILLILNIGLAIFGMLIEGVAALVIVAPTMLVLGAQLGLDPIHLGIFVDVNLLIGLLTPPVAPSLFIAAAIARAPFGGVVRAVLPFYIPLFGTVLLVTYVPQTVLFLPNLIWGP
ncbi:TRAP transporter large permease [Afifella sp. IM 167]|uniref:TRAP transporter large permease n=1 Tax=Afifella sp. IM 167 TaxID=2033586 RepID=UPI001CC98918|nr:TRAP transporter large permease [Afifella sp. IM 167]MBZ8135147.1 C4-dicarboxylate ABC transporter permease [Afifella sp. IM 167]